MPDETNVKYNRTPLTATTINKIAGPILNLHVNVITAVIPMCYPRLGLVIKCYTVFVIHVR